MGVDLGVRSFAVFGLPASPEDEPLAQVHDLPRGRSRADELHELRYQFSEYVLPSDFVFVEEPPKVRNMRTFGQLSMTAGAILSATFKGYVVPVDSWKKATVGRGGVSKDDVAGWLALHHPELHKYCAGNQNLVDAACIALYGDLAVTTAGGTAGALARYLDLPI